MLEQKGRSTRIVWAFAAIYLIWGTTYLAVRIGVTTLPPFLMGAMRYSLAGTAFLLWARSKNETLLNGNVGKNLLLGAVMQTGGQAILFWSEQYISSGFTAILVATEPIWFILLDKPQWKFCLQNKLVLLGVASGFVGIIVLFQNLLSQSGVASHGHSLQVVASAVVLLGAALWAGGSLYFKYSNMGGSLHLNLGWQLVGGVLSCLLVSLCTGEWTHFTFGQVSFPSWLSVFYLAVAGSIIALSCYNWLLTKKPSSVVGTYAYINPMIAVLVGSIAANEQIRAIQVVGMVIILLSAWLINKAHLQTAS